MTIISKKKNWNPWENCQKVCSQIVLKCLYSVRIGRPYILCSVNKLARSITKWTKACDKRLSRLISSIIIQVNTGKIVMWETLPNNAGWDCFKTPMLQGILRIQHLHQVEHCAFLEVVRLFQSVGCLRNKLQIRTVQQNQKYFLGRRIEVGRHIRAWFMDLIVAVLGNTNQSHKERGDPFMNKREVRSTPHTIQKRKQSQGVINDMDNVGFIPSDVNSSRQEALLYIFEDNEAVIKMIIKGRSATMRHVSRTHRVALDWLFERINLDPRSKSNALTPKTNSQTYWQSEISHLMNGITLVFVQHQPFQFHQLSWSDVEKNATRSRWRKSHSKIEPDDDIGLAMQREGS